MLTNKVNLAWHKEWRKQVMDAFVNCNNVDMGDYVEIPTKEWERLEKALMQAPSRTIPFIEAIAEQEVSTTSNSGILRLVAGRQPLPENTEIFTNSDTWETISDVALSSANSVPNIHSDTEPFWLHGWQDLWHRLRVPNE